MNILDVLCERRFETIENLAFEFSVSIRTIKYDIEALSLSYPIYTVTGPGGGVHITDDYRHGKKYLTDTERDLLERLSKGLDGQDAITLRAIMSKFTPAINGGKK